ncbi:hypothetical protein K443DRAFT_676640 [Laccaria amethystina LaAM-08-1]|uniref:Arsenical-resistance protein n=1 Tax=Laccaria amethystina LaAM-08-1 TaxID=1095629 RepID=A0A0C9XFF5_9AGAR|nr:hypothetical protein K443DRAFT_676640 [Laccaria amethystina LaAM-08-1]
MDSKSQGGRHASRRSISAASPGTTRLQTTPDVTFKNLRLLTPLVLLFMTIGIIIGGALPHVREVFERIKLGGVPAPIAVGLIVMMWPVLTRVQYEEFLTIFSSSLIWVHIAISFALNWIIGPLLMLGLAWATLPNSPKFRLGVIMVGLSRCIAMGMIWSNLARGDCDYCAIVVVFNAILQTILYPPYALLFVDLVGEHDPIRVSYVATAVSVLIYMGIPLVAGVVTRYSVWALKGKEFLNGTFLPSIAPISLLGLLYAILVLSAYQAHRFIRDITPLIRVLLPLALYSVIMFSSTLAMMFSFSKREGNGNRRFAYDVAVVQAFTASSNNFGSAIGIAIAMYGINSEEALPAMIAPLADIPVLLALTWLAPYIKKKFQWGTLESVSDHKKRRFELRVRLDFHQYTDEQHDTPVKKASESLFSTTKSLARLSLPGCTV